MVSQGTRYLGFEGVFVSPGSPVTALVYKNKTYITYTIQNTSLNLDDAFNFCQQLSPAGELVLPVDAESNEVLHDLVINQSQ